MIEEKNEEISGETTEKNSKGFILENLVWKEGPKGKWYLDKRECVPVEDTDTKEPDIVLFDMESYESKNDKSYKKVESGDTVITDSGKFVVNKIEEGQVFIQKESEEVSVPLESVKKTINVNFIVVGRTKTHLIENVAININFSVRDLKNLVAEFLNIPTEIIGLFFKDQSLDNDSYVRSLDIIDGESILVGFSANEETIYKRSTSKDYSWYDQKNLISFTVSKPIIVSAFGFWKHTDSNPATYDFSLYEVNNNNEKLLILQMNNVTVLPSECDSFYVKKVPCTTTILKPDVKYYAYVIYKINDMRTYYAYYGTANQTVQGVQFIMLDYSETGYKSSSTTGHMPYIYFKIHNPYED